MACSICNEPSTGHVHDGDNRYEHYFTVGKDETTFNAALRWRKLATQLANDVLSLAEDAGMPDSYQETDHRMKRARSLTTDLAGLQR